MVKKIYWIVMKIMFFVRCTVSFFQFFCLPTIMSQLSPCFSIFLSPMSRGITLFPLSWVFAWLLLTQMCFTSSEIDTHTQVYHSDFSLLWPMEKPTHRLQWGTLCNHGALSIKRNMISVVLIWNHVLPPLC